MKEVERANTTKAGCGAATEDLPESRTDLRTVGCMAHTRRKFFEAAKVTNKSGAARDGLASIAKLYGIGKLLGDHDRVETFPEEREKLAAPVLAQFNQWLDQKQSTVLSSSSLGKAISYALDQWPRLDAVSRDSVPSSRHRPG